MASACGSTRRSTGQCARAGEGARQGRTALR
jgi:hypothetical protein